MKRGWKSQRPRGANYWLACSRSPRILIDQFQSAPLGNVSRARARAFTVHLIRIPECFSSLSSLVVIQRAFLSSACRSISSIASRLVTFETAAVGPFKPSISNHCPRAIAMVPLYGKEKWRKDIDEWKRVGRARIGSFRSRNVACPATFTIAFNSIGNWFQLTMWHIN